MKFQALALLHLIASIEGAEFFTVGSWIKQSEARSSCARRGGVIASFHSSTEFRAGQAKCKSQCRARGKKDKNCGCWTGIRDDKKEGRMYNQDGSTKDYVMYSSGKVRNKGKYPWAPGEPNNWFNEDCVHLRGKKDYKLNDEDCSDRFFPLCRVVTPAPTTSPTPSPTLDGCDFDINSYLETCYCSNSTEGGLIDGRTANFASAQAPGDRPMPGGGPRGDSGGFEGRPAPDSNQRPVGGAQNEYPENQRTWVTPDDVGAVLGEFRNDIFANSFCFSLANLATVALLIAAYHCASNGAWSQKKGYAFVDGIDSEMDDEKQSF